jgi:hypothetical protein
MTRSITSSQTRASGRFAFDWPTKILHESEGHADNTGHGYISTTEMSLLASIQRWHDADSLTDDESPGLNYSKALPQNPLILRAAAQGHFRFVTAARERPF